MKLKFTKMHGAGNDFIVIDAVNQDVALSAQQWRQLANRRLGIGADQILVVEKPRSIGNDFRYRIYNADGGEVEQCGNGARAFMKYVSDYGLTEKTSIRVETMTGVITPSLQADGRVTVDMGAPMTTPAQVPFDTSGLTPRTVCDEALWPLEVAARTVWIGALSMGNPHAVQEVEDVETAAVLLDGPRIESHARFAKRVNAGFMQIVERNFIRLRVFERGAGETLACGSGACAAVVSGMRRGALDSPVTVAMHGGMLTVAWAGSQTPVYLTGPAVTVFDGEIEIAS